MSKPNLKAELGEAYEMWKKENLLLSNCCGAPDRDGHIDSNNLGRCPQCHEGCVFETIPFDEWLHYNYPITE